MAITRAQQAKQMLREGGRIGLKDGISLESFLEGKITFDYESIMQILDSPEWTQED